MHFLWHDGEQTDLGTLGGPTASVGGDNTPVPPYMAPHAEFRHLLNLRGQVAGVSATADGSFHPFLWEDGTMTDLGELPGGCDYASPSALNLWGQVVGGCTRGTSPGASCGGTAG